MNVLVEENLEQMMLDSTVHEYMMDVVEKKRENDEMEGHAKRLTLQM